MSRPLLTFIKDKQFKRVPWVTGVLFEELCTFYTHYLFKVKSVNNSRESLTSVERNAAAGAIKVLKRGTEEFLEFPGYLTVNAPVSVSNLVHRVTATLTWFCRLPFRNAAIPKRYETKCYLCSVHASAHRAYQASKNDSRFVWYFGLPLVELNSMIA